MLPARQTESVQKNHCFEVMPSSWTTISQLTQHKSQPYIVRWFQLEPYLDPFIDLSPNETFSQILLWLCTGFAIKLLDQTKRQRVIIESLLGFEANLGKQFSFRLIFASTLPKFIFTRKSSRLIFTKELQASCPQPRRPSSAESPRGLPGNQDDGRIYGIG